jgi:hypothetical protein
MRFRKGSRLFQEKLAVRFRMGKRNKLRPGTGKDIGNILFPLLKSCFFNTLFSRDSSLIPAVLIWDTSDYI